MTWNSAGDSPMEIPVTCPKCYPVLCEDPEYVYAVSWCKAHSPMLEGIDDAAAKLNLPGNAGTGNGVEAGGDGNRDICDLIHGRSRVGRGNG